jgi:hypothetical protein
MVRLPRRNIGPVPTLAAGTWAAAGNRFTKRTLVPPLPIGSYTSKISSVPLTGGQASGTILGFAGATGSVTSPGTFANITSTITIPAGGTYKVQWSVTLAGTLSSADTDNFVLVQNDTIIATSVNADTAGTYPQAPVTITASPGDTLLVGVPAGGTAGAVYSAVISSQALPLTLQVGPQGLGTTWYPAQMTLSTTTGALDTSTALVYLGSGGVPTTLVATVFTGNGTAALAVPPMQPGDYLIVTWSNGHPGDTASFNTIGTQDALTTGPGR